MVIKHTIHLNFTFCVKWFMVTFESKNNSVNDSIIQQYYSFHGVLGDALRPTSGPSSPPGWEQLTQNIPLL